MARYFLCAHMAKATRVLRRSVGRGSSPATPTLLLYPAMLPFGFLCHHYFTLNRYEYAAILVIFDCDGAHVGNFGLRAAVVW